MEETSARLQAVVLRINELESLMQQRERRGVLPPGSPQRARDVYWYIVFAGTEVEEAYRDPGLGISGGEIDSPWGSAELMQKTDEILARTQPFEATAEQMWDAHEPVHGSWQGPIRRLETAVNRYFHQAHPHM